MNELVAGPPPISTTKRAGPGVPLSADPRAKLMIEVGLKSTWTAKSVSSRSVLLVLTVDPKRNKSSAVSNERLMLPALFFRPMANTLKD